MALEDENIPELQPLPEIERPGGVYPELSNNALIARFGMNILVKAGAVLMPVSLIADVVANGGSTAEKALTVGSAAVAPFLYKHIKADQSGIRAELRHRIYATDNMDNY